MTEAKDIKINENMKIVKDTEMTLVKTIHEARYKMTGISLNKNTVFRFKDGPHVINERIQVPSFQYPQQPSYDNPIVGFMHNPAGNNGLNVIMSDGSRSNLT
jgi:hypothetical protein